VEGAGYKVGQADHLVCELTEVVKQNTHLPVMAKMTPNITDMNVPAMQAKKGGADAIAAINTVRSISGIDLDSLIPNPNVDGKSAVSGYSGPAVKPIGLRFIAEMAANKELNLPLSGMGGIETWIDALEYILVGASTVQVTTGIIRYGYKIVEDMIEGLSDYMEQKKITSVVELVGRAVPRIIETKDFNIKRQGIANYDMDRCIGCGQCYTVCHDAGGQALSWKSEERRPVLDEDKCLSCMVCSFVCPVSGMIQYKEMPGTWRRKDVCVKGE
jgi:dihydropyrimidine dehydrogenase (NAD+) subunit PreA